MKLLIVDDDSDVLNDVAAAIKPSGYIYDTATNPLKALEMYKQQHFDVVITDVRMPEMSGLELLKRIRKMDPEAKVIIITAFGDLDTAVSAINNHAYSFFGKPVNFAELIAVLRQIENEEHGMKPGKKDDAQLKEEYKKLKIAYEALIKILAIQDKK